MARRYIPQVRSAVLPDDGAWTELNGEDVLILSVTEWQGQLKVSSRGYEYVWLYDRQSKAYIFCIRMSDGEERAIAFPREHAGTLLQDGRAYEPFTILVTDQPLDKIGEQSQFLLFRDVKLKRHPEAGW
ncbi:hypothetical protein [Polycladomyces subterraneus]|uniref:Dipeptidylpeptidase IV N-terminal domain-containing protein n=1 Tax=Polycladomyces subterraneus TaxID=1016997 RepID=A0ABT8IQA0_9BACL|nr:hypothetical protein [Polycladomyces subterraneus]MDN4594284.1 hypothetical protein [Polycladomyces subterraneus]